MVIPDFLATAVKYLFIKTDKNAPTGTKMQKKKKHIYIYYNMI